MTTLIKTQCPSCQAYFSLPQAQLNELNAKARCGRCQQVFLVNENLVVSGDDRSNTDSNFTSFEKSKNNNSQQDNNFLSSDTLIYDDMPVDDIEESNSEYNSLDEMSAWFSELDTTNLDSEPTDSKPATTVDNQSNIEPNDQDTLFEESDYVVNTRPQYNIGSVAANDINASIDNINMSNDNDNAWLEKLLEEQNNDTNTIESDTDLSQLLASMGVPLRDQTQISPKQISNGQSRIYPSQTLAQTSAASILWVAGCLVLIMLLFAQYVIFNLDNIVKNPAHAARLQAVCAVAACSLPSADMAAFDITDLVYKPSDIMDADVFTDITATLANQSTKSQLLPSLKVSIYDNNALTGEFIALPKDYLASKQNLLFAEQNKSFMFTVPVTINHISKVTINPIY
ncbi:DUF3426 domain-containing protein [Psychrobacter sp. S1-30-MNA-CIBAN-0213]|uniref:DUF3426 domain-containing protein n=1 Tax=unclassified Psychrobacter TaxID=196806 RepID=UPI003330813A